MTSHADNHDGSLTQLQRIDAVCEQFEQAWLAGQSPQMETFLQAADLACRPQLFQELLRLDYEYRCKAGAPPSPDEYYARFPEYQHAIGSTWRVALADPDTGSQPAAALVFRPQAPRFAPGDRIEEFEIQEELGRGSFGRVYRAWQHGVDREVALKVSPAASHEPRTLAQLDGHPNIVRMYDQRQLADRNLHLVYMELVKGVTLRSIIAQVREGDGQQELPDGRGGAWCEQVCRVGAPLAEALDHAHRKGYLHCDIKPANIMLDQQGVPKLLDFNIAHRTSLKPTEVGGTLPYMSAEQFEAYKQTDEGERASKAKVLDGRSDIYSLGVVLWELFVGSRPFEDLENRGDWTATLTSMAEQRRDGPSQHALAAWPAGASDGLRQVLVRCLAPNPDDRYATAGELARQLRALAQTNLQNLFYPARDGWRAWALKRPLLVLIFVGVLCNVLPCALNIYYNRQIVDQAGGDAGRHYKGLVIAINTLAYSLAILASAYLARPVARALRLLRAGDSTEPGEWVASRCLRLGHYGALVVLAAWGTASPLWGILMVWLGLGPSKSLHIAASVFLSGLIAAALTFFAETLVCVRVFLPRLVRETQAPREADLSLHLNGYLGLLLFCPFAAILVLVLAAGDEPLARELLCWLLAIGVAGICVGLACARNIRVNLELLSRHDACR